MEVKEDWYPILIKTCKDNGVEFLSTATSFRSIEWMERAGVSMYKVASGNATHLPILDRLIEIGKPIILSLGLLELDEIIETVDYFKSKGFEQLSLLHCHVEYPTPVSKANLDNIFVLRELFEKEKITIGYSDHTLSTFIPALAVAKGAKIIEKHVYLYKGNLGMDYDVAISLDQFAEMVNFVRESDKSSNVDFRLNKETKIEYRRSFHAKRDIEQGEILSFENMKISRPEKGILPKYYKNVIGRATKKAIESDAPIQWEDIK